MNIGGEYLKTVTQWFRETKITAEKAIEQLTESKLFQERAVIIHSSFLFPTCRLINN
jgi:hypothetical protein